MNLYIVEPKDDTTGENLFVICAADKEQAVRLHVEYWNSASDEYSVDDFRVWHVTGVKLDDPTPRVMEYFSEVKEL